MGVEKLDKIFNPKRIAIIGASDREDSIGAKLMRNLVGTGFSGAVYPVNPFKSAVQGVTAYPNILKIPWKVDLAIIATPAHTVPQIVEECGKAGVSGVIIVSAGFREACIGGEPLEKQVIEHGRKYNLRVIGPNSLGIIRPSIKLNATFVDRPVAAGRIAFISQSAALCASVLDWASEAGIGFSAVVSTGSMIDVDFGDLIDYFGADTQTRSIILYMENVGNARKFLSAARGFARAKPIIVIKAGRFPESREVALSHAGAICGEDEVYDAAFRRAGMVRVEAIKDLFNCAEALAMQSSPKGPNLTIITNAGGPAIMAIDTLIAKGGHLTKLSDETIQLLRKNLPPYCRAANPVDVFEEATTDRFRKVMEICFRDPNSDGFLIIYTPQGAADPISTAKTLIELAKGLKKPVLASFIGEGACRKARQILQRNGVPAFSTPEEAAATFMYMCTYTQNLELLYQTPEEISIDFSIPTFLKELLKKAISEDRTVLCQSEALQFLESYAIPVLESIVAKTPEEAEAAASKLGYPVVMKAVSPQMIHKSKAGGVILNVWSKEEVQIFFEELARRVRACNADFKGVLIQPMIRDRGLELLLGAKRDLEFGSVIIFGAGGVNAELTRDISVGLPPLNQVLARRIIEKTRIYRSFAENNLNLRLLEEILVKFSQLVVDFPEIKEMEINPLMVTEKGAFAVDARIIVDKEAVSKEPRLHQHIVISPYPRKYVTTFKMKNGMQVTLRPIKPEDESMLRAFYQSLSEETIRLRFLQSIYQFPRELLTRQCNLDYDREIAIVAESEDRKIIAMGMLTTDPGRKSGEFAVVVGDRWQGMGLGSKLVDYLVKISEDMALESIYAYISSDNVKMINLCSEKKFKIERINGELVKASLSLSSS
ncbi:MAG: bifunctional acetate--CoA ligase family protein/GNAT family N-acetyltransferase [Nitrososphaerota archaeon]|nr:bifunctional acetate--CoA ligase family protein/GNAT family N-acetyltransferase [Candidatus Bathyarchaeota archaeon]MDW8194534.1 bifunctional acetate--CoA ligase family protein/GNAT family N-acetyltransferase [Nitrososphaerota archaeon]